MTHPARLLTIAYLLSLMGGLSLLALGAGVLVAGAAIWLGGALLALLLPLTPGIGRAFRRSEGALAHRSVQRADEEAALGRALAAWEADRRADASGDKRRATADAPA